MKVISNQLRRSAQGQECTLNIPGACRYSPDTVVLCHFPDEFNGMGTKASDVSAGFGCDGCHAVLDGRANHTSLSREDREFYMRRSMLRTWSVWIDLGLIRIAGAKP